MTNYTDLRTLGLGYLEKMNGGAWTDFNAHDPGITILEALCYALTDLDYRTEHDIPDLLADGGSDPHASLHKPADLLTTRAVTAQDLRRLVLDVVGVKNAWIEPVEERLPPNEVPLVGLYRVVLETSEEREGLQVRREVGQRLHKHRALCEDFSDIVVLEPFDICVDAKVEIGRVDDPAATYAAVLDAMGEIISPTIRFSSLAERIAAQVPIDDVFVGPLLNHGFLPDEALSRPRDRAIHVSDIVHAAMDVPGVRSVTEVVLRSGDKQDLWSFDVPLNRAARLDRARSKIQLLNAGLPVAMGVASPAPPFPERIPLGPNAGMTLPSGRNRDVSRYHSMQHHLPMIYGVGAAGLSDAVSTERKALAKQLKAFLLFFDQLMANHLAQLAHVKDLFSIHPDASSRTYFTQLVNEPALRLESVTTATQNTLDALAEDSGEAFARKDRFLNHLLARFAENLNDRYAASFTNGALAPSTLIKQKQAFLEEYPRISGSRGTAYDGLESWGKKNPSGLEDRIRFKLGLDDTQGETMAMIEHILMRPTQLHRFEAFWDNLPGNVRDPYSMRITFVFPGTQGRLANLAFRELVEQTVRSQTPAHIGTYVLWLDAAQWTTFNTQHLEWRRLRREHFASKLGISLGLDARLRTLVSNLPVLPGITLVQTTSPRVADYNAIATVSVDGSQEGNAMYSLLRDADKAVVSSAAVVGTGKTIAIDSVALTEDLVLRVQVARVFDDTKLLDAAMPVKVRANPALTVTATSNAYIKAAGETLTIEVANSQTSVSYRAYKRTLGDTDFFGARPANAPTVTLPALTGITTQTSTVWAAPPSAEALKGPGYVAGYPAKQGTGGTISPDVGTMATTADDVLVIVQAHKEHGATPTNATDVQLNQAVLFLARPGTATGLTLTKKSATSIAVTGGEPGVFYYLLHPTTNTLLGKPAYFHRKLDATQNRGIRYMRIGRDFALACGPVTVAQNATRATTAPLDPIVAVSAIPSTNTVTVMAVRGRTGAPWSATQTKTLVIPPP